MQHVSTLDVRGDCDLNPVTPHHTLIIPKRHVADFFDLYQPEINAVHGLLWETQKEIEGLDEAVTGFNVGVNSGEDAGQTIFHCHIHLIPRRKGDAKNPFYTPEGAWDDMVARGAAMRGSEFEDVDMPLEDGLALALATGKYETLAQIKADRSRLGSMARVDRAQWVEDFENAGDKVHTLVNYQNMDVTDSVIKSVLSGQPLESWINIPTSKLEEIINVLQPLKDKAQKMQVEYLEAKSQRVVNLNEFGGAIIPTNNAKLRQALESSGINKIFEYSNDAEHRAFINKFPELFYNKQPTGLMDELQ